MNRFGKNLLSSVAVACASASLLAGCGGSGGTSPSAVPVAQPSAAPTTAPQYPTAQLLLTFPYGSRTSSHARAPHYVSPGSTQVEVIVNTINGSAPAGGFLYADVTTNLVFSGGGQNCTVSGGTASCTISVVAPPGNVNYTFNTKDGSNNVLSTVTTTIANATGVNNLPSVTLKGVVKTVSVTGSALAANTSIAAGETLTVTAQDASGNTIVNGTNAANFNNPITLTDNDVTGQTKLTLNGGAAASSIIVSSPTDVVKLTYTGQAVNGFTITASGTGITGSGSISTTVNDVTFAGTTLDDAGHGGLNTDANWGQDTLFFLQPSGTQNVSGLELGWTNAPFSQQFDLDAGSGSGGTCGSGGGIATFSASPATTFTVTAHGSGVCSVRLKEHGTGYPITGHAANSAGSATHDGTFWISVTTSDVTVNGKQHRN